MRIGQNIPRTSRGFLGQKSRVRAISKGTRRHRMDLSDVLVDISDEGQHIEEWLDGKKDGESHTTDDLETVVKPPHYDPQFGYDETPIDNTNNRVFLRKIGEMTKAVNDARRRKRWRLAVAKSVHYIRTKMS